MLIHDHNLSRTTDMDGLVGKLILPTCVVRMPGVKKGEEFKGERVPTLREFLELVKDRKDIELNIELKDYPGESGAFAYDPAIKP